MADLREALDRILILCNQSATYTRRVQLIHDEAMRALGLTANQRRARHCAVFERIGDAPGRTAYLARMEKRAAKLAAKFGDDADEKTI
jgi:hypothetical protein